MWRGVGKFQGSHEEPTMPNEPLNYESPRPEPPSDWISVLYMLVALTIGGSVILGVVTAIVLLIVRLTG